MARVVLHVGPHKTGTTALQAFFSRNRAALRDRGVLYATLGPDEPNAHGIIAAFRKDSIYRSAAEGHLSRFLAEAGDDLLLVSSEIMADPTIDTEGILDCLEGHDVTAIGWLRNPCDIIVSAYNEVVRDPKVRRTHPLSEPPLPYDATQRAALRPWMARTRLVLSPYDPPQWVGGSLASDALALLGIDGSGLEHDVGRWNERHPSGAVELIREANRLGLTEPTRGALINLLRGASFEHEEAAMPPELAERLREAMRGALPTLSPFFREGFRTDYLFA